MKLSADSLLQGALYAVEQAGFLLRDAVDLFERNRYASSIVLGVFCLEELGRARICLEKRRAVLQSSTVTAKELRNLCDDHMEKLLRGPGFVQIKVTTNMLKSLGKGKDLLKFTDRRLKQKKQRRAVETHKKRERALYVDLEETGNRWNRPCETTKKECARLLSEVAQAYEMLLKRWQSRTEPDLAMAIEAWPQRPTLPPPIYPSVREAEEEP